MNHTTPKAVGLDPAVLRDELFELWNRKNLQTLHLAALQGFSKLSEPLEALLTILEGCPGKQKGRSQTLSQHILMEFQTWMKEHPQVTLRSLSEQQAMTLQQRALSLLTETHPSFVDGLINIYQLSSLDPAILRLHIIMLHNLHCYKEAAVLSIKLELQEELNMEEMCVPLILQNKLPLAESFVTGHHHLEQRLVTLLDSWCHPSFSLEEISKQFPRFSVTRQCMNLIQPKMLTKHVFRLMEKFNMDQGLCPNALHKRRLDSLRFLMYKRFVEKNMTEENWSDHVQYVVADDLELQIQLVEMLVKYCGLQKSSQWSLRYNIPRNRLPCGVWETQQSLPPHLQQIGCGSAQTEEWMPSQSHCKKFYQVPITKDKVHFVDSPEALHRCRNIVLKEGGIVGVDMEWQPTFGCNSTQQVALIQLGVLDQVFLLDLCANGFCQHPDTISFIRSLFSEKSILKLGYGMSGDLKCLLATWHQLLEEPLKMEGMLDLLNIHKKIQCRKINRIQKGPREVMVGEHSAEKGLSLLVQQVLGKPLDKTEQMSNWEKRPLRISQIRYAVADAYCLLDVHSVLSSNPANYGLPADLRSISSSQSEESAEKKKEKQAKQIKQAHEKEECQGAQRVSPPRSDAEKGLLCGEKPSEDTPPLPPQQLRVVCDNMLQGLGRYLRCLGVDVVMLENTDDHRVAAKLAQAEGRFILTCGQPFQSLRSQVGEGRCLSLDCSEKARDQAVRVLKHFNVQLTPSDIFSRCQACNCDQYVAVPRKDMVKMLQQKGFLQDQDISDYSQQQQLEEDKLGDILTPSVTPEIHRYVQCQWAPLSGLDPDTLTFPGGAPVQLHTVPPALLPRIPLFYVCTRCGKVFWEGSHFGRVLSMFQDVLNITDEDTESAAAAQQN
ncbi:exonuclease mut-7 homolog [Centropristis striata]|uniref:exonuclease mut-7 homolog n=1 Tax=Centropristis striata TaxID=184440 RepID=UPI0027E17ECC|nr:exonuclease mut-7 homolog [Centropristis striata]XP_059214380.1 exonuclease mut-7 homolog [Centropristis striata]